MADISWNVFATNSFTPEELDCAKSGGQWDRQSQTCIFARPLPPAPPLVPQVVSTGTVDPDQMFADGFVYVNGRWVKADSAEARGASIPPSATGGRVGSASVSTVIISGSVLGYDVPVAAAVVLPSFVGGLLGVVRLGGGMRASSGGTPKRVVMGPANVLPQVRMGVDGWGR